MKINKSADKLLRESFYMKCRLIASAVDTCQGTMPIWGQLVLAGLVEQRPMSPFGHQFSYAITKYGEEYLKTNKRKPST